jgi:Rod binding domain-containing protein
MNASAISTQGHPAAIPQPRLVQAAHEFEAQMMKELLKPMTAGASMDGDESDPESGGVMADFATEALGQSLSQQGGLGIATSILRSLSQNEKDSPDTPQTGRETSVSSKIFAAALK